MSLFKRDADGSQVRELLRRALASLPTRKRKHSESRTDFSDVALIAKFAQLEYKHGQVEFGRSLFEDLITTLGKRTDIWDLYLDQEIRQGDVDRFLSIELYLTLQNSNSSQSGDISTEYDNEAYEAFLQALPQV